MKASTLEYFLAASEILTEVEGMKAENQHRVHCGHSIAYGEDAFQEKAKALSLLRTGFKALQLLAPRQ